MARRKSAAAAAETAPETQETGENLSGINPADEAAMAREAEERDGAVLPADATGPITGVIVPAPKAVRTPKPKPTFDEMGDEGEVAARALTERIRTHTGKLYEMLGEAKARRAWAAIGYPNWEDYVRAEFDTTERYANRLVNQGAVIKRLTDAAGVPIKVTERQARDIVGNIDTVAAQAAEAAANAADPQAAVEQVVEAARAPRSTRERTQRNTAAAAQVLTPTEVEAARRREERAAEREAARTEAAEAAASTDPTTALLAAIERLNDATEALLHCSTSGIDPTTAAIVSEAMTGHLDVVANWHRQFRNEVVADHALEQQAAEALSEQMQREAEAQATAAANGAVTPEQAEGLEAEALAEAVATGDTPEALAAAHTGDPSEF